MSDGPVAQSRGFRHEALFYATHDELIEQVSEFVVDGLVRGEPAVVAVSGEKIEALRAALGGDHQGVFFADMGQIGRNPACLIPAYHEFITTNAPDGPSRGVGEPVGPHRRGAELVECQIHESLCNLAFTTTGWWVLCPYDTSALGRATVDEACRSHPVLLENGRRRVSPAYRDPAALEGPLGDPLPEPPEPTRRLTFDADRLHDVRRSVSDYASVAGLDAERASRLVLAVDQVVTNTLHRAAGEGVLDLWREGPAVLAEVRDPIPVSDPLVGREPPELGARAGRGLRAANQLCDLLQVRSGPSGTRVRVHMSLPG